MTQPSDTHSITEFFHDPKLSAQIAADGRPHVLTEDGNPKFVVQDARAYGELLGSLERAQMVQGIRDGLESMRRGEGIPAREALEAIRLRNGIPRQS